MAQQTEGWADFHLLDSQFDLVCFWVFFHPPVVPPASHKDPPTISLCCCFLPVVTDGRMDGQGMLKHLRLTIDSGNSTLQGWGVPQPQRTHPGWMGLGETWPSGRCPLEIIFRVLSNPNHSGILPMWSLVPPDTALVPTRLTLCLSSFWHCWLLQTGKAARFSSLS